jgi:hypothetical protein
MTDISDFVQQSHNFIALWYSRRTAAAWIAHYPALGRRPVTG